MFVAARKRSPLLASLLLCAPIGAALLIARPLRPPVAPVAVCLPEAHETSLDRQTATGLENQHMRTYLELQGYRASCLHKHHKPEARILYLFSHPDAPRAKQAIDALAPKLRPQQHA